jgi:hypothetical protein
MSRPTKLWNNPTNKQLYANIVVRKLPDFNHGDPVCGEMNASNYPYPRIVGGLVPLNNNNLGNQFGNRVGRENLVILIYEF